MKRVRFDDKVVVHYIPEGEDRRSDLLDRLRFARRIKSLEPLLTPVLLDKVINMITNHRSVSLQDEAERETRD